MALAANILEKVLAINAKAASLILTKTAPHLGYDVDFYPPVAGTDSIYGGEMDNAFKYAVEPTESRRVIIQGILVERLASADRTLDPYAATPVYLFLEKEKEFVQDTKMVIHLKHRRELHFKVGDELVLEGVDEPLYRKYLLHPMEGMIWDVPVVSTQPSDVTVHVGSVFELSVGVAGTAPTFQWKRNGVAVLGATEAVYSKVSELGDAGNYTVVVFNERGSVTSQVAKLVVTA